jgi:hypothetical protein
MIERSKDETLAPNAGGTFASTAIRATASSQQVCFATVDHWTTVVSDDELNGNDASFHAVMEPLAQQAQEQGFGGDIYIMQSAAGELMGAKGNLKVGNGSITPAQYQATRSRVWTSCAKPDIQTLIAGLNRGLVGSTAYFDGKMDPTIVFPTPNPGPSSVGPSLASSGLSPGTYVYVSGNGMPMDDFIVSPTGRYTLGPNLSGKCSGHGTHYNCSDLLCGLPCEPGLPVTVQPNGDLLIAGDDGPSGLQAIYRLSTK